jgi:hypothetical protein
MDRQPPISRHVVSLTQRKPSFSSILGSITRVEKSSFRFSAAFPSAGWSCRRMVFATPS